MIRIILLRHGETTWNIEGRYQGQEDTPLSPRGIEQGKAAALALKDIHIDRAISSPLSVAAAFNNALADLGQPLVV